MIKMNLDYDEKLVEEYIRKIQKLVPEAKVDVNNVNDFALMLRERECCRNCHSLDECGNYEKGYYTEYVDGNFINVECRHKKDYRIKYNKESLIKTLYLPNKILQARLDDFDLNSESRKKIYTKLTEFLHKYKSHDNPKGLYLFGTFGIGKTYTLACIANELSRNDISSLLIYFPDLVVDLKNAMGSDRFENLINMLKSVDVLMLDDIGSENMTPWLRDEILGPIINYRLLEGKPLFISSNIYPRDIKKHLAIDNQPANQLKADRIATRLISMVDGICMDDSNKYNR